MTLIGVTFFVQSCKKQNTKPADQLSLLPAATQTGADTFGCLVNGQAFTPKGSVSSGPAVQCYYSYISGGFNFTVSGSNDGGNNFIKDVTLRTDSLAVSQGETITLRAPSAGNATASYTVFQGLGETEYSTNNPVTGALTITKLDQANRIVSGTFYFNAADAAGDTVKVADGRFDMRYTQ